MLFRSNLDQEQIDAFNSKFESYIGTNKRGTDIRTLCDTVKSSNAADEENAIKITYGSDTNKTSQADILDIRNKLKNGSRYDVTAKFNKNTKLIESIEIKDAE